MLNRINPFIFFFLFCLSISYSQGLIINEFLASNSKGLIDANGDFEDWIELYNTGASVINLTDYALSDDIMQPYKWEFPAISLAPGEYLLIYASGKDRYQSELHTNFKISKSGEALYLTNGQQELVDYTPPIHLEPDISYGRYPDAGSSFKFFVNPTPNGPNTTKGFNEILDLPIPSSNSGYYDQGFYLKLYHPDTAVFFRYTLDGSMPNDLSPVFPDSLWIDDISMTANKISSIPTTSLGSAWYRWYPPMDTVFKGTNIRINSYKPDCISFNTLTEVYYVHENMRDRYNLPMVSLSINESDLFGPTGIQTNYNSVGLNWERDVHIKYFEPDGKLGFETDAGIRTHGGNSRRYALKSFRLYFRSSYGLNTVDYRIFKNKPFVASERLILRNSGSDWGRTYFRDAFVQDILRGFTDVEYQGYQPSITTVNGEYWGVMNLRERYDDNYIRLNYNVNKFDILLNTNSIDYGSNSHYLSLIDFLQNNDLNEPDNYEEVKSRMDVDDFRDYHILQIYSMNTDQPGKNARFWKSEELDNRWRWMWYDMDDSFNYGDHNPYDRSGLIYCSGLDSIADNSPNSSSSSPAWAPNGVTQTFPLRALLSSSSFKTSFINRFADLLNTAFEPTYLHDKLDSISALIDPYMEEHYRRWHRPKPDFRNMHKNYILAFIENRQEFMRQDIVRFFDLTGEYTMNLEIGSGDGYIHVNTIAIDTQTPSIHYPVYPWTGKYFDDVPITIRAVPRPGFMFSHWDGYVYSTTNEIEISTDEDVDIFAHFVPEDIGSNTPLLLDESVTIYPNPFMDLIYIDFETELIYHKELRVIDIMGKIVFSGHLSEKETTINLGFLKSGVYIIKLSDENGFNLTKRIVRQ